MEAISRVWYNGSYTIAAKPIKTLELHYTMIQFLIKRHSTNRLTNQIAGNALFSSEIILKWNITWLIKDEDGNRIKTHIQNKQQQKLKLFKLRKETN